jgi:hypothetical protein
MSTIQAKAQLVANDLQAAPTPGPSPVDIITTIISIITDVMKAFSACGNTPAQAQARMSHPGLLEKITLKNSIRHHVGSIALRTPMFHSILKVSAHTTEADTSAMMVEVKGA